MGNGFDQEDPFKKYGGQEVLDKEDPFQKYGGSLVPSKKKGLLGGVAEIGASVSSGLGSDEKKTLTDYIYSIKPHSEKEQAVPLKENTLVNAPVKKQERSFDLKLDEKSVAGGYNKINEIMYDEGDKWKDPVKELQSQKPQTQQESNDLNAAAYLTRQSLLPSGSKAKEVLSTTHFKDAGEDNQTANMLRDRVAQYDKVVQPFRDFKFYSGDQVTNEPTNDYTAKDRLYNTAIQAYANKNPAFKNQLQAAGIDLNSDALLHSLGDNDAKRGQIMADILSDPDFSDFIKNERPNLFPAVKEISDNLIYDNKDYGEVQIANEISRDMQKGGYNAIDPVFNFSKNAKEAGDATAQKLYASDPKKLQLYEENKDEVLDMLDTPSFFEGFASAGKEFGKGIVNTFTEPFTPISETMKNNWEKEASVVNADPQGAMKYIRDVGHATGLVSSIMATGNVLGIANPKTAGAAATGLGFFGDELEKGKVKYPDRPFTAWSSAVLNTGMYVALSYDLLPKTKAIQAFEKVKPELSNIVENLTAKKITLETARQEGATAVKQALDFAGGSLSKSAKISLELGGVAAVDKAFDKIAGLDDETFEKYHPDDEIAKTLKSSFFTFLPITAVGKLGEMKRGNKIVEESLYEAATNPKRYDRVIDELEIKDPSVNTQELRDNLKFLIDTKAELDARGVDPKNQKRFLFEAMNTKVKSEALSKVPDANIIRKGAEEIGGHQEILERILNGEDVVGEQAIKTPEQEIIQKALANNEIQGMYKSMAEEAVKTPEGAKQLLEDANSQINNKVEGELGDSGEAARNTFGKTISDHLTESTAAESTMPEKIIHDGQEYQDIPRIRQLIKEADEISATLPKVEEGNVRLWRGNREGEVGKNPSFTNSLVGIALPFQKAYKGSLSYVDIPESDLPKYEQKGVVSEGNEFILPPELANKAIEIKSSTMPVEGKGFKTKEEIFKLPEHERETAIDDLIYGAEHHVNRDALDRKTGEPVKLGKYSAKEFIQNNSISGNEVAIDLVNKLSKHPYFNDVKVYVTDKLEKGVKGEAIVTAGLIKVNPQVDAETLAHEMMHGVTSMIFVRPYKDLTTSEKGLRDGVNKIIKEFDPNYSYLDKALGKFGYSRSQYAQELIAEAFVGSKFAEDLNKNNVTVGRTRQIDKNLLQRIIDKIIEFFGGEVVKTETVKEKTGVVDALRNVFVSHGKISSERLREINKPIGGYGHLSNHSRQVDIDAAVKRMREAGFTDSEISTEFKKKGIDESKITSNETILPEDKADKQSNLPPEDTKQPAGTPPETGGEAEGGQVPPSEPPPAKPEAGGRKGRLNDKGILNHLYEATNVPEAAKEGFKQEGLRYNTKSQKEAQDVAKSVIEFVGMDEALSMAESQKFDGDVNSMIFAESLNKLAEQSDKAATPEEKAELDKRFAEVGIAYDKAARSGGRFNAAINHFYKKSPLGIVMIENEKRQQDFTDWSKPKDKSWKEFFEDLKKEPEFDAIIKEQVEEGVKKDRAESRTARKKKVDDFFDKAKDQFKGGATYSTIIPPKIITAALEGMRQAYHAGEKVVELVEKAIDYISKELGNDNWDKDKFRKEWNDKLKDKTGRKPLTDEEVKTRILDKFRKKLKGLSDKERDEVIRKAFAKIIESGGLDYQDFRDIIGQVTGRAELTPEQAERLKELVKITNSVEDAAQKAREERTPEALANFRKAEIEAGKAAKELQDMFNNKPDIVKRLTSIMQLNTLGIASLVNNPVYNIWNQATLRFPVGFVNSAIDMFGKRTEQEYNIVQSQLEFWNKLGLGTQESFKQLFTGLNRMDYIQKEVQGQRIRPIQSWRDLFNKKKKLSGTQKFDKILQGTVGIPAEAVARVLNLGDKPQRFAAEGSQAAAFAKALGLKDMDYKLFIEFPREESYNAYKALGYSDAEASQKADYVKEAIIKEGQRSTFQQDNLLNDLLTRAFSVFGGKDSGTANLLKTLTISPYIKIPSNAFWSFYNLLNPEVALLQSMVHKGRSVSYKGKGEHVKEKMQNREARYWLAHAIVGMATRAVVLGLLGKNIITPNSDSDDSKKERDATSLYGKQGSIKVGNMDISLRWFGQPGMLLNSMAKKYQDQTPEQREKQDEFFNIVFGGMELEGLKEAQNGLFANSSSLLQSIDGGNFDRYLTNTINMFANIIQPASIAQFNRANINEVPTSRGDNLLSKIDQQFAQRSPLYRAITGTHIDKKLDIWGQQIPKGGNVLSRMFGISKADTKQFGRPIYEDAVRTGDSGFLPPSVLPTLNGTKLKEIQYDDLQNRIGTDRKNLVGPYVNDMATIEGYNVTYSQLTDADRKFVLNYLYDEGRRLGLEKFYEDYPELKPKKEEIDYNQQVKEEIFKILSKYKK